MKIDKTLLTRANNACELSGTTDDLTTFAVGPNADGSPATTIVVTQSLSDQLEGNSDVEPNDWRCLNDSMWSETEAVKVVAYRMLHQLREEGWPQDLLDMIYLEEETLEWATAGLPDETALVPTDSLVRATTASDRK
jgi:protein PhnA